jgi:hypothetical protein
MFIISKSLQSQDVQYFLYSLHHENEWIRRSKFFFNIISSISSGHILDATRKYAVEIGPAKTIKYIKKNKKKKRVSVR